MTTAAPAPPAAAGPASGDGTGEPRKPRKTFILVGVVLAAALGVGLFTSVGTSPGSKGNPQPGGSVPSFTAANIGLTGPHHLAVPAGGVPTVLLFFGSWCSACQGELPPLAAAVRRQDERGGALAHVDVIGVDSEDSTSAGKSFIEKEGVTFPVASDPNLNITEGDFYFDGDPDAVFVSADGTIARIVRGAQLTPSSFTADERALIPSGT